MSFKSKIESIAYKINCKKNIRIQKNLLTKKRKDILNYYDQNATEDTEIKKAVAFLKNHPIQTFCYDFIKSYRWNEVKVYTDTSKGLSYVIHEGKRLYFVRSYRKRTIQYIYSGLLAEQDPASPHCYLGDGFDIQDNDVLLDVGSAEGILSLHHIEKLKQVVLFERDPQWVEALEATFEPWKEKVTIVRKYVSDLDNDENIKLDTYLADKDFQPSIIKIDVEGAEKRVLDGMTESKKISGLKIAICTYHQAPDYSILSALLTQNGYTCLTSNGLMLFLNNLESLQAPFFRKGLIRATKEII